MDKRILCFVINGNLNLREEATFTSKILVTIPDKTLLLVTPYNDSWHFTTYGRNKGFVRKEYVALLRLENLSPITGIVTSGALNMRRTASRLSERLVQIPNNKSLSVIDFDVSNEWYIAEYAGYTGYIMKRYISVCRIADNWSYGQVMVDDLNVRKKPDQTAMRWNNVWPENRIALVKHMSKNWHETLYRGEQAFVSAEFITLLDCKVPSDIVQRMLYMVGAEIGRVNAVYFNGYTGQWCHRFADWLAMHAGTPKNLIPNTSNCGKGIVWFVNDAESGGFYFKNAEHKARMISNYSAIRHLPKELTEEEEAYTPSPGDYIYFRWRNAAKDVNVSHVGIVSGVSEDKLTTVEGNAGGAVANRSYALNDDRIVGYGKPRYDAAI